MKSFTAYVRVAALIILVALACLTVAIRSPKVDPQLVSVVLKGAGASFVAILILAKGLKWLSGRRRT